MGGGGCEATSVLARFSYPDEADSGPTMLLEKSPPFYGVNVSIYYSKNYDRIVVRVRE
jgi:hypothetical protein